MKAPETMGSADRKAGEDRAPKRAARTKEHGPIGFHHVLGSVRSAKKGAQEHPASHGSATAAHAQKDPKELRHEAQTSVFGMDISHLFTAGALPSSGAPQTLTATAAVVHHNEIDGQQQQTLNTQAALKAIAQSAANMNADHEIKELRIQLEPEHLGPLVVKLKLRDGHLHAELHVDNAEAAAKLQSGSAGLRDTLASLGYASAEVVIGQQPASFFDTDE